VSEVPLYSYSIGTSAIQRYSLPCRMAPQRLPPDTLAFCAYIVRDFLRLFEIVRDCSRLFEITTQNVDADTAVSASARG
jgi:hypothetical protein